MKITIMDCTLIYCINKTIEVLKDFKINTIITVVLNCSEFKTTTNINDALLIQWCSTVEKSVELLYNGLYNFTASVKLKF